MRNFHELVERARASGRRMRVAVVGADDEHTLQAVFRGSDDGIVEPILVGGLAGIRSTLDRLGLELPAENLVHAEGAVAAARRGVELVRSGCAQFLMKGKLQTAELLAAAVDRENGLRTGLIISHIALYSIPRYHKLLVDTDGGMVMYPDLAQKKAITENAVSLLRALGYECPKVAVLAAVETRNEKMPETVDAAALRAMNAEGSLSGCIVEGPISYDLATDPEAVRIKGYDSPVGGDADILVVPNIITGNVLGKCLTCSAGAAMAGIVVGARAPIIVTSRGSSSEEKYYSIVLAAAATAAGTSWTKGRLS
jgi:phosphate butyryltransferase